MNPVLILGGAGFVGTNLAASLLEQGRPVLLLDNLSRKGVEDNLDALLHHRHAHLLRFVEGDIRDADAVGSAVAESGGVVHLAAQVAVTTSLVNPAEDFDINARGTLNVLEAIRTRKGGPIPLVFTSTNKVYGALDDVALELREDRYSPCDPDTKRYGIGEERPLDFHSPYGCSKGAADQYVLDYARSYDVPATAFRMSCIYGPHQKGTEDQGWVAHFLLQILRGEPLTLYGDGKQVRDILWVGDAVRAFEWALSHPGKVSARAFNLGGGPRNAVSLLGVVESVEAYYGEAARIEWGDWRMGDQRFYVSDTRRFEQLSGWYAHTDAREGLIRLFEWLRRNTSVPAQAEAMLA